MDEEQYEAWQRTLAATLSAQTFLIENLLATAFLKYPKADRTAWAQEILKMASESEQFSGLAKDDYQAERLSDMIVLTQGLIERSVGRALASANQAAP